MSRYPTQFYLKLWFLYPGPDIPFVAVYKTQRDAESETQDRESEYTFWFDNFIIMLKTLHVTLKLLT